jgi:hydroxypyruvate isomerase
MPRFAANTSFLFTEVPFLERFAAARRAGFGAVEFHFPYAHSPAEVAAAARSAATEVVLFNLPAGNWEQGDRGIACHPDRVIEFRDGVARAIQYARALECPRVNCLAGIAPRDADPDRVLSTFVDNVRYAADAFAGEGLQLLTEPLNTRSVPGFYLNTTPQALDILSKVGADNFKIQYDIFHMQIMEGDLAATIESTLPHIGHVQDRHEPGTGEVNFGFLFSRIDHIGYGGWMGAEYLPSKRTSETLGWFEKFR